MAKSQSAGKSVVLAIKKTVLGIGRCIVPPRFRSRLDPARCFLRNILTKLDKSREEQRRLDLMIGPQGYWLEMQKYQINLLKRLGLEPHHTLLDIGCGPLSGGLAFIPYLEPGNYFGVDIKDSSIAEAHIQVAKAGLAEKNPTLIVSDNFGVRELNEHKFDFIWASQMTYHLDANMFDTLLQQVASRLKPGGKFYADFLSSADMAAPDKRWLEFSFHYRSLEDAGAIARKYGLEMSNFGAISEYDYPVHWGLRRNHLLEFRKCEAQAA